MKILIADSAVRLLQGHEKSSKIPTFVNVSLRRVATVASQSRVTNLLQPIHDPFATHQAAFGML